MRELIDMRKVFRTRDEVVKFWSRYSKESDVREGIQEYYTTKQIYDKIVKVSNPTKDSLILDVGCGWGRIARQFVEDGCNRVIGVDLTYDLLESFRKDGFLIPLINADAVSLPLRSFAFDLVYAVRVLQYFDDFRPVLKELVRVLRMNGKLVVVQPNPMNPYRKINYHTKLIPPTSVIESFKSLGLQNVDIEYFGFSFPQFHLPFLEYIGAVPFLKRMGGFYLVKGEVL